MSTSTTSDLITLHNVCAYHLLGTETIPLTPDSPQDLAILSDSSSTPPSLTLTIGPSLAFPLNKKTSSFGTQSSNPRGYFLKPIIGGDQASGPSGWIKLELAEGVIESGERDKFEDILVQAGLLVGEVVEAKADDIASTIREMTATVLSSTSHPESEPEQPTEFSSSTHSSLAAASSVVGSIRSVTDAASATVLDLTNKLGVAAGESLGLKGEPTPESAKSDLRRDAESIGTATYTLGAGVVEGITNTASSGLSKVQVAIHETYGQEAEEVALEAGGTIKDAGAIVQDGMMATSGYAHGFEVGKGAIGSTGQDSAGGSKGE